MEKFSESLQELMIEKNLTQKELSISIGVAHTTVGDWLNGAVPSLENLFKLSDFFQCSIDYLVNRSDQKEFIYTKNPSTFFERLNLLIEKSNSNPCRTLRACNLRTSEYYDWKYGSTPMLDKIITLADYFECSIDFLVGRAANK